MAGVGVVAHCVHAWLVVCLSRSLVLEAGAGGAGSAEASVWTWPSSWEVVGSDQVDRVADQIGRVHARIIRWWEPVRSELASCGRLIGMRWANRSAGLAG
jgi:hypothetical protein